MKKVFIVFLFSVSMIGGISTIVSAETTHKSTISRLQGVIEGITFYHHNVFIWDTKNGRVYTDNNGTPIRAEIALNLGRTYYEGRVEYNGTYDPKWRGNNDKTRRCQWKVYIADTWFYFNI